MNSFTNNNSYFFVPKGSRKTAPLFVFLPGMDETGKELMTIQIGNLETVFDVRCFVIPPDNMTGWDHLASQAIALTRSALAQKPQTTAYLCGESFGGCLALKILRRSPELFDHIILINPASSFPRIPWLNLGSYLLPWTPNWIYESSAILALPFLAHLQDLSAESRKSLLKATRLAPRHTAAKRLELLRNFQIEERQLQQLKQPVLLIASEGDRLFPSVAEIKRLAQFFQHAQVITLAHSGHACLIENDVNLHLLLERNRFLPFVK